MASSLLSLKWPLGSNGLSGGESSVSGVVLVLTLPRGDALESMPLSVSSSRREARWEAILALGLLGRYLLAAGMAEHRDKVGIRGCSTA